MGNICHAGPTVGSDGGKSRSAPSRHPLSFGKDPTLKREDFIFSNIQTASFLAKLPGSINGQQFLIEDCHNCDIFLLDHCTSVQIDACVNCRIVVGPCESSVFLRDCKRCTLVCAVQQFRARDCEDVDVYLYSATEPIIETSSCMKFACFPLTYFSLQQQFQQAKFTPWNNHWSEIYNFTPDHGQWKPLPTQPSESPLAAKMPMEENGTRSLWKMPSWTAEELGISIDLTQLVVPLTSGVCARKENATTALVCFSMPKDAVMIDFVSSIAAKQTGACTGGSRDPTLLIRTRQMKFTQEQAAMLFAEKTTHYERAVEAAKCTLGSVVMEFQGPLCYEHVSDALQAPMIASDAATRDSAFVSKDTVAALHMSDLIFQQWKPEI